VLFVEKSLFSKNCFAVLPKDS